MKRLIKKSDVVDMRGALFKKRKEDEVRQYKEYENLQMESSDAFFEIKGRYDSLLKTPIFGMGTLSKAFNYAKQVDLNNLDAGTYNKLTMIYQNISDVIPKLESIDQELLNFANVWRSKTTLSELGSVYAANETHKSLANLLVEFYNFKASFESATV